MSEYYTSETTPINSRDDLLKYISYVQTFMESKTCDLSVEKKYCFDEGMGFFDIYISSPKKEYDFTFDPHGNLHTTLYDPIKNEIFTFPVIKMNVENIADTEGFTAFLEEILKDFV